MGSDLYHLALFDDFVLQIRCRCSDIDDHPTTSTRVIDLSHDLAAAPAERTDDRTGAAGPGDAAGPSRAPVSKGRRGPETPSPGDAALVELVKLLARQAAEEHFRSKEE